DAVGARLDDDAVVQHAAGAVVRAREAGIEDGVVDGGVAVDLDARAVPAAVEADALGRDLGAHRVLQRDEVRVARPDTLAVVASAGGVDSDVVDGDVIGAAAESDVVVP